MLCQGEVSARRRRRPRWRCFRSRAGSRAGPRVARCRPRRSPGRGGCAFRRRSPPSRTTSPATGRGLWAGWSCAACQSPSPVRLTSTRVTGPVPDQALPRTVCVPGLSDRPVSGVGDARPHAHEADGLVRPVGPLVHVVARLELAGEALGQDVDALQPLHRRDGVPVGHDEPEGGAVVGTQRLAVHLVGDQDLRRRIGRVGERQGPSKVRSSLSVSARTGWRWYAPWSAPSKRTSTPSAAGVRLLQHLVQEGAGPARGGDRVVTPWLTDRQRSRRRVGRCLRIRA